VTGEHQNTPPEQSLDGATPSVVKQDFILRVPGKGRRVWVFRGDAMPLLENSMLRCCFGRASLRLCAIILTAAAATAQTYSVLYRFCSLANCGDGDSPQSSVTLDANGNIYGTTWGGGIGQHGHRIGDGVVYQLTALGKENALRFGGADGMNSASNVVFGDGGGYGTTFYGGANDEGTVFRVAPSGAETVLHSFCSEANCADGYRPDAGIVFDRSGNLYGTTFGGGVYGGGTVFKLTPAGSEAVLYNFCSQPSCTDGADPFAGVVLDKSGNLYGATADGGANRGSGSGGGTVFKVTPAGEETVLYSFCSLPNCADGSGPSVAVVLDASGNLYGTTPSGGGGQGGVVFKVTPAGEETVLYNFCSQSTCVDGEYPEAGVVFDASGNLYGTTSGGGVNRQGVVFELTPAGEEKVLYSFCSQPNCADGAEPYAGLVLDEGGNMYGTASLGGSGNGGVVFKLVLSRRMYRSEKKRPEG
jgi:uncharacterized repeat protein (TIGR03803 family)